MKKVGRIFAVAFSASLFGCAIHPVPEDVASLSTYDIVRNVRCEARDAIRDQILVYLGDPDSGNEVALAGQLQSDHTLWAGFSALPFKKNRPDLYALFDEFLNSAIAYNFSLDMTEVNNVDPSVTFAAPLWGGTFTSGPIGGGVDRTRDNTRSFTITDIWGKLIAVKDDYCQDFVHVKNYLYPITGKVGVNEMINNFVNIALFANLASPGSGAPPTIAEQLTFTTKLSIGASPQVVMTPVKSLGLSSANLGVSLSRQDIHKVTIGLSLPVSKTKTTGKSKPTELLITAQGNPTAQAAAQAIEQLIIRNELRATPVIVAP